MKHFITITGKNEILRHILKESTREEAVEKSRHLWRCIKKPVSLVITDVEGLILFEHIERKNGHD